MSSPRRRRSSPPRRSRRHSIPSSPSPRATWPRSTSPGCPRSRCRAGSLHRGFPCPSSSPDGPSRKPPCCAPVTPTSRRPRGTRGARPSDRGSEIRWSFNVFDNLTSRHPDGKLHPGLATEWKLQGQTAWAFKLRQGVKYHNGDPFTSADAKYSIERTYDPAAKTMVATALSTIDRIEAPDPYSLVIHTKTPDPLLPARLAFYGGQIVPKKYLESVGADTFNTKPVGTGPVRLSSWVKDDKAVFDAYPDHWCRNIHMNRLV